MWVVLAVAAVALPSANPKTVTIETDSARRDITGEYIDAHDGKIVHHKGLYFLYGEAYGDRFPPYLFLLFAHQSAEGGENAIVSSQFVVEEMARSGDPELERAAALLRTVPVEQTQHGEGGASGIDCVSPIVQYLPGGRTMIKVATSSQIPATAAQKREAKTAPPMVSETVPVGAALAERAGWDEEEAEEREPPR